MKKLTFAEEAATIHQLVAAVQSSKTVSQASRDVAQAAQQAAQAMEATLVPMDKLEVALRTARRKRDAVGGRWDAALAALKHGARFAAAEGAPGLYNALFGRLGRPTPRKAKPAPAAPSTNPASAAPVANPA